MSGESSMSTSSTSTEGSLDEECIYSCMCDSIIERKYENIIKIDRGGYSIVFSATLKVGGGKRALKMIPVDEKKYEKAIREVENLEKLRHDNIVRFYDCFKAEGNRDDDSIEFKDEGDTTPKLNTCIVIVTELCNQNLKALMLSEEMFDRKKVSLNILEGLQAIHRANIIHRDLKPGNVFIGENGVAKVGDFGLSRCLEIILDNNEGPSGTQNSLSGDCGTSLYRAPEIKMRGMINYDKRVDYYSLGVIYFELFLKIKSAMETQMLFERFLNHQKARYGIPDVENEVYEAPDNIRLVLEGLLHPEATSRIDLESAKELLTEVTQEEIEAFSEESLLSRGLDNMPSLDNLPPVQDNLFPNQSGQLDPHI